MILYVNCWPPPLAGGGGGGGARASIEHNLPQFPRGEFSGAQAALLFIIRGRVPRRAGGTKAPRWFC